jgi:predicted PurR-regulated permease PerM
MPSWSKIRAIFAAESTVASPSAPLVENAESAAALASAESVPAGLRVAAGWAWRLLLIAGLIYLLWFVASRLSEVTIPLFVAVLFTAALWPLKSWLVRHHVPRGLAVLASLLTVVVIIFGILSLVGAQIVGQWDALTTEAVNSFNQFLNW